jgi:hypothetical protein
MEVDLQKAAGQPLLSQRVSEIEVQQRRRLMQQASTTENSAPPCSTVLVMKIQYTDMTRPVWKMAEFFGEMVFPVDANRRLISHLVDDLETDPTNLVFTSFNPLFYVFDVFWGPFATRYALMTVIATVNLRHCYYGSRATTRRTNPLSVFLV